MKIPRRKLIVIGNLTESMKKAAAIGLFVVAGALVATAQGAFNPPEAFLAVDAYQHYHAVPDGLIVLDVALNADGTVAGIDALRNVGTMLDAAKKSVNRWSFQPALQGSTPQASHITVSFVYRPQGKTTESVSSNFAPVVPKAGNGGGYVPPGIVAFAYPDYPPDGIESGSVILQVSLDASGAVTSADYLHRWTPFDPLAMDALKKWRFQPATLNGKPIASKTLIAFLFE